MAPAVTGLLDTSVFIALESGRPMNVSLLPDQTVVCPVTIAELQAGALDTADVDVRARRLATLESTADIEVLDTGADVAAEWARLRVHLAQTGRRVNGNDLWIAATAAANGIPVVTPDDDVGPLEDAAGIGVIRV